MYAYELDNFYSSDTKDIEVQINEAYIDYLKSFDYTQGEPLSREEYEERYF